MAREQLADAFVLLRHCDRPEIAAERECARGRLSLACGEPARAEAAFRTGLELTRGTGFHVLAARMECWLARALARTGRRREATALLGPAMERLGAAGAMPALAVGCGARWEAGGFVEDPDLCYQPVAAWLEAEQALLPWLDWCVARLRHAAMHRDLGRVARVKEETAALQRRVLAGLGEDERRLLSMRARYRALA